MRDQERAMDAATHHDALRVMLESDRRMGLREWPIEKPAVRAEGTPALRAEGFPPKADAPPEPHASACADASRGLKLRGSEDKSERLRVLDESRVRGCTLCGLSQSRTQTVFGQGAPAARLVFVGEAPGFEEDKQGLAFVGRAGKLLTRMIVAMGLTRDEVFICNILKCRPPGNRNPAPDEIAACHPYLREQLQIIDPQVIVALGAPAAKTLLDTKESIGRLRGRFHDYYLTDMPLDARCVPLMPTYHPAYLLRSPGEKTKAWADLQMVMAKLGLTRPT